MNYFLDLFTPETWQAFRAHGGTISGFRENQKKSAERIKQGDQFLCYVVRLSRWCGLLEVASASFIDSSPIFSNPDPFMIRFRVKPLVLLDLEQAIPILEEKVWSKLTLTEGIARGVSGWAQHANLRASLRQIAEADGRMLSGLLKNQNSVKHTYSFSDQDNQRLGLKKSIRTADRAVIVEVPSEDIETSRVPEGQPEQVVRESHKVQAIVAKIGAEMGFKIWIPRSDRQKVMKEIRDELHLAFIDILPLNYDEATLRTIEQIDVIWLKGRSMSRAFEIEHTTAIYSGLLRMADLLALQPNMDIRLHIVAPSDKREKVVREIKRPVFSLLDRGPLYENCSYLSYEAVHEIAKMKHLSHMSDSIVEEYEEFAQDD